MLSSSTLSCQRQMHKLNIKYTHTHEQSIYKTKFKKYINKHPKILSIFPAYMERRSRVFCLFIWAAFGDRALWCWGQSFTCRFAYSHLFVFFFLNAQFERVPWTVDTQPIVFCESKWKWFRFIFDVRNWFCLVRFNSIDSKIILSISKKIIFVSY